MLKKMDRAITNFEIYLAGTGMLVITAVIFVNVVLRYVFHYGIVWVEEFTRYIMIWVAFVGSGLAVRRNAHVSMDAVFNKLSEAVKRWVCIIIYTISGFVCMGLTVFGVQLTMSFARSNQVSVALDWFPLWIVGVCVPLGALLMTVFYWRLAWRNITSKSCVMVLEEGDES